MRYLLILSIIFFSCAPRAYKNLTLSNADAACVSKFVPKFERSLYKADIEVAGNYLSGILLIKKMEDHSTRIVFTNQAGMSFFDFEFSKEAVFKVYSIMDKMNKKAVIKTLEKDFSLILFNKTHLPYKSYISDHDVYYSFIDKKDRYYYIMDSSCQKLIRMERGSSSKKILEAYFDNTKPEDNIPQKIILKHSNFKFNISLTQFTDHVDE